MIRRSFLTSLLAAALASPALGISKANATKLVEALVADINAVTSSGQSVAAMARKFEGIFKKYAAVSVIARFVLGPDARTASAPQLRRFTDAFVGYIARKYAKRFRDFQNADIKVERTRQSGQNFDVDCVAAVPGSGPIRVTFRISDRSGKDLMFDLLIEGISLLKSEAVEIRALLDQYGGNIDELASDLHKRG